VKSARPELKKKEVVYEVPCMDCDSKYIGETGRNLQKRLMEHKAAVRNGDRKNGIAVHLQDHDHRVNWGAASHRTSWAEPNPREKRRVGRHAYTRICLY